MPVFRHAVTLALSLCAALCAALCPAPQAMAAPPAKTGAPHLAETSFAQLPQPLPLPYDEQADAGAAIRAATAAAKAHHRLVLIDMGGNWCLDCRLLAATIALPDLSPFVRAHYEVVTVDVGRYTKNMDIPARYGVNRWQGVPMLLIVDPRTQRLLNAGHTSALADARSLSPQALADWLARWIDAPPDQRAP